MRLDNEQLTGRTGKSAGQYVTVTYVARLDQFAGGMCARVDGHTYAIPDSATLRYAPGWYERDPSGERVNVDAR